MVPENPAGPRLGEMSDSTSSHSTGTIAEHHPSPAISLPVNVGAAATADNEGCSRARAAMGDHLFHRVALGDREAFGQLYDHFATPLYSLVAHILNDPNEADSVLEEAFLRIWETAPSFNDSRGKPSSWVVMLVRDVAIARLRARAKRPWMVDEIAERTPVSGTRAGTRCGDTGMDGQTGQGRELLHPLPETQRRPIELALFGGLTGIEIAWVLGQPFGAIKTRIQRGMVQLRDDLEEEA